MPAWDAADRSQIDWLASRSRLPTRLGAAERGQGLVGGVRREQRRPERVAQRCSEQAYMTTSDLHAVLLAARGDVRQKQGPVQRQALDRQRRGDPLAALEQGARLPEDPGMLD